MIYFAAVVIVLFVASVLYVAWDILVPVREMSRRDERE